MKRVLSILAFSLGLATAEPPAPVRNAIGKQGAVATVHPIASQIALQILQKGGNAIDAAVGAGLTLGVVDGFNSGIGGGCFLLIRKADGSVVAIDGREMAPAAAHRDMFIRDGKAVPALSQTGALAVGVPGALAAYAKALKEHGTQELSKVIAPSAKVAKEGFVLTKGYVNRLTGSAAKLQNFPASAAIFLDEEGKPLQVGHRLVQSDLAKTYEAIAREGIRYFYQGTFATKIHAWMRDHGGILTKADMARYTPIEREPIRTSYRGYEVIGFPPPSSGGIHVAQMLNMLEKWDLKALSEADRYHLLAEVMKLAFADRAHWLGDSDFAKVPKGLIDKDYAKQLAAKIDLSKTTQVPGHHEPAGAATDLFGKHTTHFCVADAAGNWVACTQTVNTSYGSGVVIPGTGVVLNNEMDDFAAQPGVPNFFGLLGSEANSVAPGKRPLSSMSPTIVLKEGEPVFAVGAAGGPTIITQALQAIIHRLDFDRPLTECLSLPRIHHQWSPDRLLVESGVDAAVQEALQSRGHAIQKRRGIGVSQALMRHADGRLEAQGDPRVLSSALAY